MSNSLYIAIVDPSVRMVGCLHLNGGKTYSYKYRGEPLQEGDVVVVEANTHSGFDCVVVVEPNMPVPTDTPDIEYKWIVGAIDMKHVEKLQREDKAVSAKFNEARLKAARERAAAELGVDIQALLS